MESEKNHQVSIRVHHHALRVILWCVGVAVLLFAVLFGIEVKRAYFEIQSEKAVQPVEEWAGPQSLSSQMPPQQQSGGTDFDVSNDPAWGPPDARVTIVGFEDFECPYCREAFPIIRQVMREYEGELRFVFVDFPLMDIHPNALKAALAAGCAHEQGRFWEFHDKIFTHQEALSPAALRRFAEQVNMSLDSFDRCMAAEQFRSEIEQDISMGQDVGVRGTPTWFINGARIPGVIPVDAWRTIIEAALERSMSK